MGKPRIRVDYSLLKVPQFCCDVSGCNKFFSKLSRLKYHQNTHLEEKPYKCEYEGCSSSYYRPNHLKRHVESTHTGKTCSSSKSKEFVCPEEGCGAAFESESSLYFHSKRKHCVQPLQCSYCDRRFSKKWMFKEHEAGHTGALPFKCDVKSCEEAFRDFSLFKAHKRDHEKKTSVKSFTCPVAGCEISFQRWSELVVHKKTCHPPERQCSICQKTFSPTNLKIHLQVHEESESRVVLQCPVDGCPRFYYHQKNLTHHMRVKHEGIGFHCTICNRTLSSKQKLVQHTEVIHNNRNRIKMKKKVKEENVLKKLTTMSENDWEMKRTGPTRYIRKKYDCIKFPSDEESHSNNQLTKQSEDIDNNNCVEGDRLLEST